MILVVIYKKKSPPAAVVGIAGIKQFSTDFTFQNRELLSAYLIKVCG